MFADHHSPRFFASESSKNLRALAIKAIAKLHVRRDRIRPPIMFNVPVFFNVAHGIASSVILSEAKNLGLFLNNARRKPKMNQRCFAALNMTKGRLTLEISPMHKV